MKETKKENFFSKITKKQWIIIAVALVLIIGVIVTAVVLSNGDNKDSAQNKEEEVIINDSADIIKEATYEGLTINNIILKSQGDFATFTATVTNSTDNEINVEDFDIVLKNGDTTVATLYGYLGEPMAAGESRDINASIGMALTKDTVTSAEYAEHTAE